MHCAEFLQFRSQFLHYALDVLLREVVFLNLGNVRDRLCEERYSLACIATVGAAKLEVCPCAPCCHGSILIDGDVSGSSVERSVTVSKVIVAVVYHLIIYVGAVVSVGSGCRIVCELLEIGICIGGRRYEFASHFSNEEILVGSLLHSLCDAEGIIDGVYLLIERWILDHAVVIYTEHILTRCGREESQRCYYCIYYFHCCFVVLLSCCLVVCLVYTFNKITKQQNNQTTNLQINLHTKHEGTALCDCSAVDALIEDAVASAELRVDACVFGEGEDILCLSPYGESLEP